MSDSREYPAYVVLTPSAVYHCGTLAEALERRGEEGVVYEPLGMPAAREVAKLEDQGHAG